MSLHSDICKIILAVLLPPLGVFLERGCNAVRTHILLQQTIRLSDMVLYVGLPHQHPLDHTGLHSWYHPCLVSESRPTR